MATAIAEMKEYFYSHKTMNKRKFMEILKNTKD